MSGSLQVPNIDTGSWYCSQAAEESKVVSTSRGLLWSLYAINVSGATVYVYVFDNTAASGTVLAGPFEIPTGVARAVDVRYAIPYNTGLTIAASSTGATFTATGTADLRLTVGYAVNTKRKDQ